MGSPSVRRTLRRSAMSMLPVWLVSRTARALRREASAASTRESPRSPWTSSSAAARLDPAWAEEPAEVSDETKEANSEASIPPELSASRDETTRAIWPCDGLNPSAATASINSDASSVPESSTSNASNTCSTAEDIPPTANQQTAAKKREMPQNDCNDCECEWCNGC